MPLVNLFQGPKAEKFGLRLVQALFISLLIPYILPLGKGTQPLFGKLHNRVIPNPYLPHAQ